MTADTQSKRLSGRTAIVTGAGTGIGQGAAVAFAKEGANLVIVGRTLDTLQTTVGLVEKAGGKIHCVQGSVSEAGTAERAVAESLKTFGSVDILYNNAHSFTPNLPMDATPEADFRTHMESGFFGSYYFMQACFPQMKKQGGGSIINTGSIAGTNGWANFAPYAAAKEAIRGMTCSAARDWAKYKIRVNVIVPAAYSKISEETFKDPAAFKAMLAMIPLGYLGDSELDIGRVAVFLASDDSRYVTAQTIHADGGM